MGGWGETQGEHQTAAPRDRTEQTSSKKNIFSNCVWRREIEKAAIEFVKCTHLISYCPSEIKTKVERGYLNIGYLNFSYLGNYGTLPECVLYTTAGCGYFLPPFRKYPSLLLDPPPIFKKEWWLIRERGKEKLSGSSPDPRPTLLLLKIGRRESRPQGQPLNHRKFRKLGRKKYTSGENQGARTGDLGDSRLLFYPSFHTLALIFEDFVFEFPLLVSFSQYSLEIVKNRIEEFGILSSSCHIHDEYDGEGGGGT